MADGESQASLNPHKCRPGTINNLHACLNYFQEVRTRDTVPISVIEMNTDEGQGRETAERNVWTRRGWRGAGQACPRCVPGAHGEGGEESLRA